MGFLVTAGRAKPGRSRSRLSSRQRGYALGALSVNVPPTSRRSREVSSGDRAVPPRHSSARRANAPISPLQRAERVCCLPGANWYFVQELFAHFYTVKIASKRGAMAVESKLVGEKCRVEPVTGAVCCGNVPPRPFTKVDREKCNLRPRHDTVCALFAMWLTGDMPLPTSSRSSRRFPRDI